MVPVLAHREEWLVRALCVVFAAYCGSSLWSAWKTGWIAPVSEDPAAAPTGRAKSPVGFWFYVVFYAMLAAMCLTLAFWPWPLTWDTALSPACPR